MSFECSACGNKEAIKLKVYYDKDIGRQECCDVCGDLSLSVSNPDVYWKGAGYDNSLPDKEGNPTFVYSKSHKAKLLKDRNLMECGDMSRGVRGGTECLERMSGTFLSSKVKRFKKNNTVVKTEPFRGGK